MKNKKYWLDWLQKAGVRAIRTVAQAAISIIGTSAIIGDVNWVVVGSSALLAGILSMLTSLAGLPEIEAEKEE